MCAWARNEKWEHFWVAGNVMETCDKTLQRNPTTKEICTDFRRSVQITQAPGIRSAREDQCVRGRITRCQARHIPEMECAAYAFTRGTFTQCAACELNVPGPRMYKWAEYMLAIDGKPRNWGRGMNECSATQKKVAMGQIRIQTT
ncbi:hypothetical protein B0H13DRAFT_2266903 [Mycena leptocephala]|nr:hypothetical protein B0H13DRAFT_2266903 [Mycena leptocephala]